MCRIISQKLLQNTYSERLKILVVDDDLLTRRSTINLLTSAMQRSNSEYEIIEGSDGLDIIETVSYDTDKLLKLIITDENMLTTLGSEAIKAISIIRGSIHIVSITSDDEVGHIYDSGADMVFKKPVCKRLIDELFLNLGL